MRTIVIGFCVVTLTACSSSSATSTSSGAGGDEGTTTAGQGVTSSGVTSTGVTSTGSTSGSGGSNSGPCMAGAVAVLPACSNSPASSIDVPSGCTPTVDGAYHEGEWSDAVCIKVGNDPVYAKYSGDTLYLAWPMTPSCGCPAQLAFNTDGAQTLDGKQIDLDIFDDPFSATGDGGEATSSNGAWGMPMNGVTGGIVIANPPNTPPLVTYEVSIPFAALGITAGAAKAVGFGVNHPMSGVWPSGLTVPMGMYQPTNPADWGQLTSSANWQ